MSSANRSGEPVGEADGATQALYRALVFDAELLPLPQSAKAALHELCRAMLASGVFTAAEVVEPDAAHGGWTCVGGCRECAAAIAELPGVAAAAARSWRDGSVQTVQGRGGANCAVVAPVRRAGGTRQLLLLGGAREQAMAEPALALVGRAGELLGHALDQIDWKAGLMRDCALQGYAARHDLRTGLPNELAFAERIGRACALGASEQGCFAVGLLRVARGVGRETAGADSAPREFARLLRATSRQRDLVALLDDGVFGLLIRDLDPACAQPALDQVLRRWTDTLQAASGPSLLLRVGVALAPARPEQAAELLCLARGALQQAELAGAGQSCWRVVTA